jgi:hypothetical protein
MRKVFTVFVNDNSCMPPVVTPEPITDESLHPLSDKDRIPFMSGIVRIYRNGVLVGVETGTMINALNRGLNRHPDATHFSLDQSCQNERAIMERADQIRKENGLAAESWRM